MSKIGILGGTFNPIHNGHLYLADNAYKCLKLDKVLIMPSGISYLKEKDIIQSKDIRASMVKMAIEQYPYFEFSNIELIREGDTYTYETLLELKNKNDHDEFYFIVGADTLFNIEDWMNPQIIFDNCIIAVMVRDDTTLNDISNKTSELMNKYNAKILFIDAIRQDVSSSEIRNMFKAGEYDKVKDLLPKKVFDFIVSNKLY